MWTAKNDHYDTCELLIDKGANINTRDDNNYDFTVLMTAAQNGHYDICELIINKGAKINTTTYQSNTALILAARHGHYDICNLLIKNGANIDNINTKGMHGDTALICTAQYDYSEISKLLINNGADTSIKNDAPFRGLGIYMHITRNYSSKALMCAANKSNTKVCKSIISHTIILPAISKKIDISRKTLYTLLHIMKANKIPKDVRYLIFNNTEELKNQLSPILIHLIRKGKKVPQALLNMVIAKITSTTIDQLIPMMVEAQSKTINPKLKTLLDPELLKAEFGEKISDNIKRVINLKKLHLFIWRKKESESCVVQ